MIVLIAPLLHHYVCSEVPSEPESSYLNSGMRLRPLDEDELEKVAYYLGHLIDEAWYWYAEGNYDGSGQLLMRKGTLWDMHDMSHCSCYGPIDEARFTGRYESLEKLWDACTEEQQAEVKPLVGMARKAGFF